MLIPRNKADLSGKGDKGKVQIRLEGVLAKNAMLDVVSDNQPSVNYTNTIWYRLHAVAKPLFYVNAIVPDKILPKQSRFGLLDFELGLFLLCHLITL